MEILYKTWDVIKRVVWTISDPPIVTITTVMGNRGLIDVRTEKTLISIWKILKSLLEMLIATSAIARYVQVMSRNLRLQSKTDGFFLVQTPTTVTDEAMKAYDTGYGDPAGTAIRVYRQYLLDNKIYEPDEVERIVDQINAFIAFAPNARFYGW